MSEQQGGGRYQRSTTGLIGAMVVTVALVVAFVVFRDTNRDDLVVEPEPVDYLVVVESIQTGDVGFEVAYPPELPEGWRATAANYQPDPLWSLSLLTEDDEFVGVRQGPADVEDLVDEFVDEEAEEGEEVTLDSPLARRWRSFTDAGGDYALAAQVGDAAVLVVGTAGEQTVAEVTGSLVTGRVPPS